MKILYVCHRLPFPPKRGGKIRPFNMIRHLHAAHEVTVASLARSPVEAEEGRGLEAHCARVEFDVVRAPRYATAVGLLLEGAAQLRQGKLAQQGGSVGAVLGRMREWFQRNF